MQFHGSTGPSGSSLTRALLSSLPRRRLHGGRNRTKAVVDLVECGDGAVVVKDVAPRSWIVRHVLGPWQLAREARAYRRLEGLPGIPRLVAVVDRSAIVLQHIPGSVLRDLRPGDLDPGFFDRLADLVAAMHARGVAHGDLHHGDVIAGPGGQPYLIDFSTSTLGPAGGGPGGFVFEQMRRADDRGVAKLRRRLGPPGSPDPPPRPPLLRFGVALRRLLGGRR
jgi:serine/threonine protein kinase